MLGNVHSKIHANLRTMLLGCQPKDRYPSSMQVRACCMLCSYRQSGLTAEMKTRVAKITTVVAILCHRLLSKRRYLKRTVRFDRLNNKTLHPCMSYKASKV
jgi:hypothetical protein